MQRDIIFTTVPFSDTNKPLMAPAILKSIATQAGKTSLVIDLNAEFRCYIETLDDNTRFKILAFFREEQWTTEIVDMAFVLLSQWAKKILSYSPKIVGISLLTYNCQAAAKYLAWMLKKIDPDVKVILGGAGILTHFAGRATFAEQLQKNGVIDFYVYGDGEKALYHYLTSGNTKFSGISMYNWTQLNRHEVESLPTPDYDDYDFSLYEQPLKLPILGSRGCVRSCTFCDVHSHWEKFTYRSGQHVFNEMITLNQKYGVTQFDFTDSLINGNLKEYRHMVRLIAEHNLNLPESEQITWGGFFIFRSKKEFTENDWKLTAEGGGRLLIVGIETLNDTVRKELGKNFTNNDIEFSLEMARKFGARSQFGLLFFTGYPTETDKDYEDQVQWWRDHKSFTDVIAFVNPGTPLGILDNTPLKENFDSLGLIQVGPAPEDWTNPANNNTPEKRVAWNSMIRNVLAECNFTDAGGHDTHYIIERMRKRHG